MSALKFLREKYAYILGFVIIEAGVYYFNGPTGNFTTGFLGLFGVWLFYAWMSRSDPKGQNDPADRFERRAP